MKWSQKVMKNTMFLNKSQGKPSHILLVAPDLYANTHTHRERESCFFPKEK